MNFKAALLVGIAIGCLGVRAEGASEFEVASIKPSAPGNQRQACKALPGGLFVCHNASVEFLLRLALGYVPVAIKGAPSWLGDRYDLDAKVEGAGKMTEEELAPPMLALFRDRFGLLAHQETIQQNVYILEQTKSGAKLKPSAPGTGYSFKRSNENVLLMGETMELFAAFLERRPDVNATVIDNTGLEGKFDFTFPYINGGGNEVPADAAPEEVAKRTAASVSSTFDAVNLIGLRLRSEKRDGTALVIEQIHRPTEN
jgi:uncharacterized protein (TIGR03435 family)